MAHLVGISALPDGDPHCVRDQVDSTIFAYLSQQKFLLLLIAFELINKMIDKNNTKDTDNVLKCIFIRWQC